MCGKSDIKNILCDQCSKNLNICECNALSSIMPDKIDIKNINENNEDIKNFENKIHSNESKIQDENIKIDAGDDVLAVMTQWTRKLFLNIHDVAKKVQRSRSYKILTQTTQPAHIIAVGVLTFVLLTICPNLLETEEENLKRLKYKQNYSSLIIATYLGAFATHFGAQIWMTFVSGLSLYFELPRHTFGLCQQVLFPKYFALGAMLSIYILIMFVKVIDGKWELSSYIQLIALATCAIIETLVRLYLAPPLLRLMTIKYKIESSVKSGEEVGYLNQGALVRCTHYQKIHKAFRKIHMTASIGNMTALMCTFMHLYYLASKIKIN